MDARLKKAQEAIAETGLAIYALRHSVGREMTTEDRRYVAVKLRSLIEILMQLHDLLIEPVVVKDQSKYSNPDQHPF